MPFKVFGVELDAMDMVAVYRVLWQVLKSKWPNSFSLKVFGRASGETKESEGNVCVIERMFPGKCYGCVDGMTHLWCVAGGVCQGAYAEYQISKRTREDYKKLHIFTCKQRLIRHLITDHLTFWQIATSDMVNLCAYQNQWILLQLGDRPQNACGYNDKRVFRNTSFEHNQQNANNNITFTPPKTKNNVSVDPTLLAMVEQKWESAILRILPGDHDKFYSNCPKHVEQKQSVCNIREI